VEQVLVIEDDIDVRENIAEVLKFKGYNVSVAMDGAIGLSKLKDQRFDLVISDIMMPGLDGYQVLQKIKKNPVTSQIPVILLTAKTMIESKIEGLEHGADDYITKPFNAKELVARVKNLIETRKMLKAKTLMEKPRRDVESVEDAFIRDLLDIFAKNLENSHFVIEDVVPLVGLSKSTVQRKVKRYTNKTFNQLLREFRLEQAKAMMERKGGNISEIAFKTGFNSVSYFSFSFKNYFGYSPTKEPAKN
jgi:DNA-binding response OmpR family regulator